MMMGIFGGRGGWISWILGVGCLGLEVRGMEFVEVAIFFDGFVGCRLLEDFEYLMCVWDE